ncbi:MAG: hypothetical protein EBU66_14810 [Bacteroidetes bacterium]|nr:hypothetical protein [bacterium]NBP65918.1 hypothetical protein [Bacteroidota bacterium]
MGIDFNDAEGIEPELLEKAQKGEATMKNTVNSDSNARKVKVKGGGTGNELPLSEVIKNSEKKLKSLEKIFNEGGFNGPDKDKYELELAHARWIHARNIERKCDNDVKETSVEYTALVDGNAETHEINKAHKIWNETREKCKDSSSDLYKYAMKYVETDKRVRDNRKAASEYPATIPIPEKKEAFKVERNTPSDGTVEGFVTGSLKEGFNFFQVGEGGANQEITAASGNTPAVLKYNKRLPLYAPRPTTDSDDNNNLTVLPWKDYYMDCNANPSNNFCESSNQAKNDYIFTINTLFDKADRLVNILYKVSLTGGQSNEEINKLLLNDKDIQSVLDNQNKTIALHKQNALYDYDEYNSLSFYEELVLFLYYAVFAIFVFMSLRDYFSSGVVDKTVVGMLIILGIYPKYILQVVLWILNTLTKIMEMLGLNNVRFWNSGH